MDSGSATLRSSGRTDYKVAILSLEAVSWTADLPIRRGTLAAIRQLRRLGLALVLATSRELAPAQVLRTSIDPDASSPLVSYGGALSTSPNREQQWHSSPIRLSLIPKILPVVTSPDVTVIFHTVEGAALTPKRTPQLAAWESTAEMFAIVANEAGQSSIRALLRGPEGPLQIDLLGNSARLRAMEQSLLTTLPGAVSVTFLSAEHAQLRSPEADKGRAVHQILARIGLSWKQVIAFGIDDSDSSLLAAASLGIAVSGATDSARAAARHYTPLEPGSMNPFADSVLQLLLRFHKL